MLAHHRYTSSLSKLEDLKSWLVGVILILLSVVPN
jgi:hypothetical protein